MAISYKHLRIKYINTNINIWTNHTQYYRTLLRAHSICMPSVIQYALVYNHNSNRIEFKSRQLANIIGKFVYYYIKCIKLYSYFYAYFKKIINTKNLKRVYHYKYYRGKQLIYTLNLKHFILLVRNKIRIKLKKKRYYLWKLFYNIPNNFWNNMSKKRIKSIIWLIFFTKNGSNHKIPKQYLNRNEKIKGNLFFFNYNKISNFIYNTFRKKRIPKKEWLVKKNIEKKKKRKRKFGVYFNNNINEDTFINTTNIYVYKNVLSKLYYLDNTPNLNYNMRSNFIKMYCNLLLYVNINLNNNYYLNLYYYFLSYIYNKRTCSEIIYMYNNNNSKYNVLKSNANNTFSFNIWYNLFIKEHNIYTYFNINNIIVYKKALYVNNYSTFFYKKNIYHYIFFIKKSINDYTRYTNINIKQINNIITNIDNFYYNKNYYNRTNFKLIPSKFKSIKKKTHSFTTRSSIYNKTIMHIKKFKKYKSINIFKTLNVLGKNILIQNKIKKNKLVVERVFRKKYYNSFKNIISSLIYNIKNKHLVVANSNINNLFINSYKTRKFYKYSYNKNKYIKNIKLNYNKKILYRNTYYRIQNTYLYNNIYIYKQKIYKKYNILNNNSSVDLIQNKIGLDIKNVYSNNLLYLYYFNNNIIYKEAILEYNIRIHNKINKYDHLFILHKNIIIYINKKNNIGNIINGILLFSNCFYINNNINNIPLLYNINKYSKLLVTPIIYFINKYYKKINNI